MNPNDANKNNILIQFEIMYNTTLCKINVLKFKKKF